MKDTFTDGKSEIFILQLIDTFPILLFHFILFFIQIIAMSLKDNLELIQKISESAGKEHQIEQALEKMEREWDNQLLVIIPYRETGTGTHT